jgi:hypothetical protein
MVYCPFLAPGSGQFFKSSYRTAYEGTVKLTWTIASAAGSESAYTPLSAS